MENTKNLSLIEKSLKESAKNIEELSNSKQTIDQIQAAADLIINAYKNGGCFFAAGNGGSAADSQHLVAEFVSKLSRDRNPIKAFSMTVDTSILTAIGNNYGYKLVFERQVRGLMSQNDIFFGISTSGNSENLFEAFKSCKELGIKSILLTGKGGKIDQENLPDIVINTPGAHTAQIQEGHIVIYHLICCLVENGLVEAGITRFI